MALQDSLDELAGKSPARKNRVDLLLEKLKAEAPDDYRTLTVALHDKNLRPVVLTAAIRKEYGTATVTDTSVSHWRSKNNAEVNGL
jgi:hypothetical protein